MLRGCVAGLATGAVWWAVEATLNWTAGGLVPARVAAQVAGLDLNPELLQAACETAKIPLTLRRQPGYDHSYYFISSFMSDHLRWHAERLKA